MSSRASPAARVLVKTESSSTGYSFPAVFTYEGRTRKLRIWSYGSPLLLLAPTKPENPPRDAIPRRDASILYPHGRCAGKPHTTYLTHGTRELNEHKLTGKTQPPRRGAASLPPAVTHRSTKRKGLPRKGETCPSGRSQAYTRRPNKQCATCDS